MANKLVEYLEFRFALLVLAFPLVADPSSMAVVKVIEIASFAVTEISSCSFVKLMLIITTISSFVK